MSFILLCVAVMWLGFQSRYPWVAGVLGILALVLYCLGGRHLVLLS